MSSPEYYQEHKETWATVYYPRRKERLKAPEVLNQKRSSNREHMRRSRPERFRRYQDNKFMFMRQLGRKCEICGFADWRALQFDHIKHEQKTCNLPSFFRRKDLAKAFDELHNCRLLCANCHALVTHESGRLRLGRFKEAK